MRSAHLLIVLMTSAGLTACGSSSSPVAPADSPVANAFGCTGTLTRAQSNPRVVAHNSSNLLAIWTFTNTSPMATIVASSQSQLRKGQVTSVNSQTDGYPITVPAGGHFNVVVGYSTGAAGSGQIFVSLFTDCTTYNNSYDVTVQ